MQILDQLALLPLLGGKRLSYLARATGAMLILMAVSIAIVTPKANAGFFRTLPQCSEPKVLTKIIRRFEKADRKLWYAGIVITSINKIAERAYNVYTDSLINRRYCRGRALMSSGKYRQVHYVIEQGMGLAGFGWGVEYCLKGSDGWHAYDGWCRVLRQ